MGFRLYFLAFRKFNLRWLCVLGLTVVILVGLILLKWSLLFLFDEPGESLILILRRLKFELVIRRNMIEVTNDCLVGVLLNFLLPHLFQLRTIFLFMLVILNFLRHLIWLFNNLSLRFFGILLLLFRFELLNQLFKLCNEVFRDLEIR
jgi:hypothetical protein